LDRVPNHNYSTLGGGATGAGSIHLPEYRASGDYGRDHGKSELLGVKTVAGVTVTLSKGFEMRRDTLKENRVDSCTDEGMSSSQHPRVSQSPYGSTIVSPGIDRGANYQIGVGNVVLIPTTSVEVIQDGKVIKTGPKTTMNRDIEA